MPSLFKPFVQLDSGLSRHYEGTGLGLALAARLAELHAGSIDVESEPGRGSRFTLWLPWQPETEPEQSLEPAAGTVTAADPATAPSGVILLAEDNQTNVDALADYLELEGYRIITAADGLQALEQWRQHKPDLVLMDIQMPRLDGLQAIARIRAESGSAQPVIIALTALAMAGDRERCLNAGADDYLSKPVSLRELGATIAARLTAARK